MLPGIELNAGLSKIEWAARWRTTRFWLLVIKNGKLFSVTYNNSPFKILARLTAFQEELIEAKPGETIRITLEVVSNMPKSAMGQNIAITDKDADAANFVMESMSAKDNEYIAPTLENQAIAYTKMIGGSETSAFEITVPEEPGDDECVCTFLGHYFAGMKGILRVQNG